MRSQKLKLQISKRAALPWYKSWAIRGCAILAALAVCSVVTMLLTGETPSASMSPSLKAPSAPPAGPGSPSRIWPFCWASLWR